MRAALAELHNTAKRVFDAVGRLDPACEVYDPLAVALGVVVEARRREHPGYGVHALGESLQALLDQAGERWAEGRARKAAE